MDEDCEILSMYYVCMYIQVEEIFESDVNNAPVNKYWVSKMLRVNLQNNKLRER